MHFHFYWNSLLFFLHSSFYFWSATSFWKPNIDEYRLMRRTWNFNHLTTLKVNSAYFLKQLWYMDSRLLAGIGIRGDHSTCGTLLRKWSHCVTFSPERNPVTIENANVVWLMQFDSSSILHAFMFRIIAVWLFKILLGNQNHLSTYLCIFLQILAVLLTKNHLWCKHCSNRAVQKQLAPIISNCKCKLTAWALRPIY